MNPIAEIEPQNEFINTDTEIKQQLKNKTTGEVVYQMKNVLSATDLYREAKKNGSINKNNNQENDETINHIEETVIKPESQKRTENVEVENNKLFTKKNNIILIVTMVISFVGGGVFYQYLR
jgi:predicted negative regulator of RcsB-dependent stress response